MKEADMKHITRTFSLFILMSIFMLSSCGSNDTDAATGVSQNGTPEQVDIITQSQQTRQDLTDNIATAQSMLSSVSSDEAPADSTEIIRHTSGTAPETYKPQGQMVTYKYRRYNTDAILTHNTGPDTITTRIPSSSSSSAGSSTDNNSDTPK